MASEKNKLFPIWPLLTLHEQNVRTNKVILRSMKKNPFDFCGVETNYLDLVAQWKKINNLDVRTLVTNGRPLRAM